MPRVTGRIWAADWRLACRSDSAGSASGVASFAVCLQVLTDDPDALPLAEWRTLAALIES